MSEYSPMMRQFLDIKKEHKDSILFFRMGDFYEMFFEDALTASRALEITLTSRDGGKGKKVPMCGIPHHAYENYIAKLIKQGFKVTICEQVEDPKTAKGLVKRAVVDKLTPGTVLLDSMLDSIKNNYLASIYIEKNKIGFSFLDISTGEFKTTQFTDEHLFISEFSRIMPSECIIPSTLNLPNKLQLFIENNKILLTKFDDWMCSYESSYDVLITLFKVHSLDGFGLRDLKMATTSSGIIITYLKQLNGKSLNHINALSVYQSSQYMLIDSVTQRNLELSDLVTVIDHTITSMGGRLLRKWLLQPLCDIEKINNRLNYVDELKNLTGKRRDIRVLLKDIADIERITSRINAQTANARDLVALSRSINTIGRLIAELGCNSIGSGMPEPYEKIDTSVSTIALTDNVAFTVGNRHACSTEEKQNMSVENNSSSKRGISLFLSNIPDLSSIAKLIETTIIAEPPLSRKTIGVINPGVSEELDELRLIKTDGKEWLRNLQETEIKRTGIKSLKVQYNKVFGYYIEITKSYLDLAPEDYIRKQTLVNAERFITPELKEKEALILGADDKTARLEQALFQDFLIKLIEYTRDFQKTAQIIAEFDVLQSLAQVADINNYIRPIINTTGDLTIIDGRHPVIESFKKDEKFIPNDTKLSTTDTQLAIITGPNMSGKSTYIRQTALLTLMAQVGSFIPAKEATVGIVDRIFTRVGAADELVRGQSTFMLEMNETSNILHNATKRSLIILDEVGRGTSTFDGVSIAWAIVEYIHDKIGARTLFATHYHELTGLANTHERIKNYRVACREWQDEVIFLHKIEEGGTDKSYGIHVARLAGLPKAVIARAREIEKEVGSEKLDMGSLSVQDISSQQDMFDDDNKDKYSDLLEQLKNIDIDNLTPIQALEKLSELKKEL